ncbi:unnamed protein product, partial [Cylindrotheca closterium]
MLNNTVTDATSSDEERDEESAMYNGKPQDGQEPLHILVTDLQEKMFTMETKLKRYEDQGVRKRPSTSRPSLKEAPMFASSMSMGMDLDPMDEEEDDEDEVRAFPHSTVSFLLLAKWPLCGHSPPEDALECSQQGHVLRAKHRSRDYMCLPFWL